MSVTVGQIYDLIAESLEAGPQEAIVGLARDDTVFVLNEGGDRTRAAVSVVLFDVVVEEGQPPRRCFGIVAPQ